MTDKVQKIREEVKKLYGNPYYMMAVKDVLAIINSSQEEPVIKETNMYIFITQKIVDYIEEHKVFFENTIPTIGKKWFIEREHTYPNVNGGNSVVEVINDKGEWMRLPKNIVEIFEEPKDRCKGCNNAKGCITCVDGSKWAHYEEPVSKDLEEASKEWLKLQLDKSYADYGEVKMMELTHFDGYAMLDAIEFGAQWQKEQIDKILLSEVLPCFMHDGKADEVVAKLDEVLNFQKK